MPRSLRPEVGLLVVGLGTLVAPLDTAVNIAFPRMTEAFELGLEGIRWVVIAYVLTYASLMLVCGRLGDLVGYRAIFQLGLALSVLGLVSCAIAPNYALLLLGRILQGIGIALTLSCGPALATSLLGEQGRTRALAFYAGVMAAGAVIGPLAGGLLVAQWGWPSVFWFRVPLPLLALALSGFLAAAPKQHPVRGFDFPGAVLLVAWMSALLLAVAMLRGPFTPAVPYGLALLGLLSFAAFLVWEARCQQPLIRLSLFHNPAFVIFNAASIAANLAAFGVLLLVPYFLLRVAHLDATSGGAVLALAAVGTMLGAWAAGRLAPRVSLERLALAGIALNIAGLWKVSTFAQELTPGDRRLVAFGAGARRRPLPGRLHRLRRAHLAALRSRRCRQPGDGHAHDWGRARRNGSVGSLRAFRSGCQSRRRRRCRLIPRRLSIHVPLHRRWSRPLPRAQPAICTHMARPNMSWVAVATGSRSIERCRRQQSGRLQIKTVASPRDFRGRRAFTPPRPPCAPPRRCHPPPGAPGARRRPRPSRGSRARCPTDG